MPVQYAVISHEGSTQVRIEVFGRQQCGPPAQLTNTEILLTESILSRYQREGAKTMERINGIIRKMVGLISSNALKQHGMKS